MKGMQAMIPPKPKGSRIEEHMTLDACTLKWHLPSSGVKAYLRALALVGVTGYLSYQSFWLFPGRPINLKSLLIPLAPLLIAIVPMLRLLKPSGPESITLGTDYFRHDLGQAGGIWGHMDAFRYHEIDSRPLWRRLFGLPLIVEIPKNELGEIVIERATQLRLRYDVGADRIEIGRYLREPEKEWLAEVIKEWQKSA
jgi:hypothetical protein